MSSTHKTGVRDWLRLQIARPGGFAAPGVPCGPGKIYRVGAVSNALVRLHKQGHIFSLRIKGQKASQYFSTAQERDSFDVAAAEAVIREQHRKTRLAIHGSKRANGKTPAITAARIALVKLAAGPNGVRSCDMKGYSSSTVGYALSSLVQVGGLVRVKRKTYSHYFLTQEAANKWLDGHVTAPTVTIAQKQRWASDAVVDMSVAKVTVYPAPRGRYAPPPEFVGAFSSMGPGRYLEGARP